MHCVKALSQFYTVFPALQKNQFFITGESYGGHYVGETPRKSLSLSFPRICAGTLMGAVACCCYLWMR